MTLTALNSVPASFEEQAREVIARYQRAFSDLMDALPVDPSSGPTEVARGLRIETKLAWKITHLLGHPDPFEAGRYIPGAAATRRFLEVAAQHRPPRPLLRGVRSACDELETMVQLHAGSRRAFDLMIAGQSHGAEGRAEQEQRKAAFHANGFLWGLQARTQVKAGIIAPSADGNRIDGVAVNAFIDLRRIRSHVPWRLTSTYSVDNEGKLSSKFDWAPLDPEIPCDGKIVPPLLKGFCSSPTPKLDPLPTSPTSMDFALAPGPVGRTAAETCVTGEIIRGVEPRYREPGYDRSALFLRMRTPCEVAVLDVFSHRDLYEMVEWEARLYSDLFTGEVLTRHRQYDELELREEIEHLGTGTSAARLPAMPRYRELLDYAFEKVGWRSEEFRLYRVRLDYPITPTDLVLSNRLGERPQ